MFLRPIASLSFAVMVLSACGSSKLENPGFATARISGGSVQGEFNPAGYSEADIARYAAPICKGRSIAGLTVTAASGGLARFSATCPEGAISDIANVEIERLPGGGVVTEVTFARDGNLVNERVDFPG